MWLSLNFHLPAYMWFPRDQWMHKVLVWSSHSSARWIPNSQVPARRSSCSSCCWSCWPWSAIMQQWRVCFGLWTHATSAWSRCCSTIRFSWRNPSCLSISVCRCASLRFIWWTWYHRDRLYSILSPLFCPPSCPGRCAVNAFSFPIWI